LENSTYFIAPNGTDNNTGTLESPFATLAKANEMVSAGDTIYLRGGTYKPPVDKITYLTKSGTADAPIRLFAYQNERPVIDGSDWTRRSTNSGGKMLIQQEGDYWHVKGIEMTGSPRQAYVATSVKGSIYENLNLHDNDNTGLSLTGEGTENNLISGGDFYRNYDPIKQGQDADGIAIKAGSGKGNVIRGARTYHNSDDGIDLYEFTDNVTIENTWSYGNGVDRWNVGDSFDGDGAGFRLATEKPPFSKQANLSHLIRNNLAWDNATRGFNYNGSEGKLRIYNNTSYNNGVSYAFNRGNHTLRNNIAVGGDLQVEPQAGVDDANNSWTLDVSADVQDFVSVDASKAEGARKADGSLPDTDFLKLKSDSDLIDAGTDIGINFVGTAPDLGAFESSSSEPPTSPPSTPTEPPTESGTVFADSYGFTAQDATQALQRAVDDPTAKKIIVRDMGSPWLVSKTVFLRSNKEIVFEEGSVVQAKPGTFLDNQKPMFRALSLDNLKLIGKGEGDNRATLKMNKEEYTTREFGHILGIDGVKNFEIRGFRLTGAGGDGIHVAGAAYKTAKPGVRSYSENGIIEDIFADNNRRQGISIDSAKDLIVRNSIFSNTSGTAPSAGIDLEPTWDFERLENVTIENVTVKDNDGNGVQLALGNLDDQSAPVSIDINNVTVDGNNRSGITVVLFNSKTGDPFRDQPDGSLPSAMANGTVNIRNTSISNSKGTNTFFDQPTAGIYVQSLSGSQDDPNNLKVNFDNVTVSDTGNGEFATNPIYIRGFGGPAQPEQIGNLSFKDVVVEDNFDRDIIKAELGRPDAYLSNISGNIEAFNPKGVTTSFDVETAPQNFSLTVNDGGTSEPSTPPTSPNPPFKPTPPTSIEPVAKYNFDNMISNVITDDSNAGQDNAGKLVNGGREEDFRGRHITLKGNGRIEIPNSTDINTGDVKPERTVSLWFKVDDKSIDSRKQVLYEEGANVRGLNAYVFDDQLFVGGWNKPKGESDWEGTWLKTEAIGSDQWHHLAFVLEGGEDVAANAFTAYLDGKAFDAGEGSQLWNHPGGIGLGAINGGTKFHDGLKVSGRNGLAGALDDVAIYNDALSAEQIEVLAR